MNFVIFIFVYVTFIYVTNGYRVDKVQGCRVSTAEGLILLSKCVTSNTMTIIGMFPDSSKVILVAPPGGLGPMPECIIATSSASKITCTLQFPVNTAMGPWYLQVLKETDILMSPQVEVFLSSSRPINSPTANGIPNGFQDVGCYSDSGGVPDMSLSVYQVSDIQMCYSICTQQGFLYFGIRFQLGCLCGNKYGSFGPGNTCSSCYANTQRTLMCGGIEDNYVYKINYMNEKSTTSPPYTRSQPDTISQPFYRTIVPVVSVAIVSSIILISCCIYRRYRKTRSNSQTNEPTTQRTRVQSRIDCEHPNNTIQVSQNEIPITDVAHYPEAEGGEETDRHKCKICFVNESNIVTIPCFHLCMCADCAKQVKACPLCRTAIQEMRRVFKG